MHPEVHVWPTVCSGGGQPELAGCAWDEETRSSVLFLCYFLIPFSVFHLMNDIQKGLS